MQKFAPRRKLIATGSFAVVLVPVNEYTNGFSVIVSEVLKSRAGIFPLYQDIGGADIAKLKRVTYFFRAHSVQGTSVNEGRMWLSVGNADRRSIQRCDPTLGHGTKCHHKLRERKHGDDLSPKEVDQELTPPFSEPTTTDVVQRFSINSARSCGAEYWLGHLPPWVHRICAVYPEANCFKPSSGMAGEEEAGKDESQKSRVRGCAFAESSYLRAVTKVCKAPVGQPPGPQV
ncbi:hypothetical protein ONS96_010052 [Cadophora gregata f. sp. sojae]|nr:hypothetical protein ONS96_010052 [Cadophora gregata f. sp. sojae]